ncbi:MAG: class I SAM-dependent methyltransferase [Bacteroidales bacterium]|jgi:SAM-dependent methyltransferase|nr:class I SAM-dependent methyltransferase [Bacteroidales bacterium]MDD4214220.1 class I SAM-dependent methyltransferase [Bacteroidales bacterium]
MEIIAKKFFDAIAKDSGFIKKWIIAWDYQLKRKKTHKKYNDSLPEDFFSYNGPEDLISWLNWFSVDYPDYFPREMVFPLLEKSKIIDKSLLTQLNLKFDYELYEKRVGINNVHDYLIPNLYPVPERNRIKNILDFGAGYGRQANLWTSQVENPVFVGMDAIPKSYCLQNLYYSNLNQNFFEYLDNPDKFKIDLDKKGIYHIPTWRSDLIPGGSFDLVICVQVLPELNSKLIRHMINEFKRILKPGGMLYIRDHASKWKPAGKINFEKYLRNNGFVLEFQPHVINDLDIFGIPRIWRKKDEQVIKSQKAQIKDKFKQFYRDCDASLSGLLSKTIKKFK